MTQITTSTNQNALGYGPQNKVAKLWDGTLLTGEYDGTANAVKLWQVSTPSGTPTFAQLAQTFAIASSTQTDFDLFVVDNGNSTNDVWLTYASNNGVAGVKVAHATYDASGVWAWDNTGTALSGIGATSGNVSSIVWTGTYLICLWRDGGSAVWSTKLSWTTTKNGSAGWQTPIQLSSTTGSGASGTPTHYQGSIHYDPTLACTVAVYPISGDTIKARVLSDAFTPALANWGSETSPATGTINVGGANLASAIDHTTGSLHVVYCDSTTSNTKSPGYVLGTITVDAVTVANNKVTWGTPFAVGTASTANVNPTIGVDASGTVFVAFGTAAAGTNSTINHAAIASPYTSASAVTSLGTAANANNHPHVPMRERFSGYMPLLFMFTKTSAFGIQYDNSITAGSGGTPQALSGTVTTAQGMSGTATVTHALAAAVAAAAGLLGSLGVTHRMSGTIAAAPALSGTLSTQRVFAGTLPASAALQGTLSISKNLAGAVQSGALIAGTLTQTDALSGAIAATPSLSGRLTAGRGGTGIASLAVTTKSQTWSGGPAGSPGTETDVTSTDSTGSGWAVGLIPSYGGMPISSVYEVDSTVASANQTSLSTSSPDGHLHILEQKGTTFAGSEDVTFAAAGNLAEQAPAGTSFRRYYKCIADTVDANGFQWTAYACIYPGDPGFIAFRFDITNPTGSAITLASSDSLEIALLGGLQQTDTTWTAANGKYNTIGGTEASWPSALTTVEPDYVYITPAGSSTISLGQLTAKKTSLAGLGWSSLQVQYLQNTNRLKVKVQGTKTSFPANTTQTIYLVNVLRRNLTITDAAAIAADYINPGTPTATFGSFTSFSYDERAYVHAASGNRLTTTLSMSGTGVTTRYKPVIKITGWTSGTAPRVAWGSANLTDGVDYRSAYDAANSVLYLQLGFDVVSSGAVTGQKNNAALDVQPSVRVPLSAAVAANAGMSAILSVGKPLTAPAIGAVPALAGTGTVSHPLVSTLSAQPGQVGTLSVAHSLAGGCASSAALAGSLTVAHRLSASVNSVAGLSGDLAGRVALSGTVTTTPAVSGTVTVGHAVAGSVSAAPALSGMLVTALRGSVAAMSGLTATLTVSHALTGVLAAAPALTGNPTISSHASSVGTATITLSWPDAVITLQQPDADIALSYPDAVITIVLGD